MAQEVCEAAMSEAAQQKHGAASSAAESEHESGNQGSGSPQCFCFHTFCGFECALNVVKLHSAKLHHTAQLVMHAVIADNPSQQVQQDVAAHR